MDFICAQPDQPLFIWQLKTLIGSMMGQNIAKEHIHLLVLLEPAALPSAEMKELEGYAKVYYYHERAEGRIYLASSKPYLFARFWEQFPENKHRHFMFVESDMLVYKVPDLPMDHNWYWSDASNFLESNQYEHMLGYPPIAGPAFGFHGYGRGVDADFWYKVEKESIELFLKMNMEQTPCNRWICEMRAWMWNSAQRFNNIISPQLIFNDGYGPRKKGATLYHQLAKKVFSKRDYTYAPPFSLEISANPNFCVYDYLQAIRTANSLFSQ